MTTTRNHRVRRTAVALGTTAAIVGVGVVFAAFTDTTTNPGNTLTAGSVVITDSASGTALFDNTNTASGQDGNMAPDAPLERCLTVTYNGTLNSAVRMYSEDLAGRANANLFRIRVDQATNAPTGGGFSCTGFVSNRTIFADALASTFPTNWGDASDQAVHGPAATWSTGGTAHVRITITAVDNSNAGERTAQVQLGSHEYTWEAQNV